MHIYVCMCIYTYIYPSPRFPADEHFTTFASEFCGLWRRKGEREEEGRWVSDGERRSGEGGEREKGRGVEREGKGGTGERQKRNEYSFITKYFSVYFLRTVSL